MLWAMWLVFGPDRLVETLGWHDAPGAPIHVDSGQHLDESCKFDGIRLENIDVGRAVLYDSHLHEPPHQCWREALAVHLGLRRPHQREDWPSKILAVPLSQGSLQL